MGAGLLMNGGRFIRADYRPSSQRRNNSQQPTSNLEPSNRRTPNRRTVEPRTVEPRTSNLEPRTSTLEPRTSNLEPRTTNIQQPGAPQVRGTPGGSTSRPPARTVCSCPASSHQPPPLTQ